MQKSHKVKIIHSEYVENSDLIRWDIIFLDDQTEQTYVWPSIDLLKALGIKKKVDKNILMKFCKDMNLKEINLVVDKEFRIKNNNITEKDYQHLTKKMEQCFEECKDFLTGA